MMLYKLIKPLLFQLDPEKAHHLTLSLLRSLSTLKGKTIIPTVNPVSVFGLEFNNRIGLAAGLDKNGDYIDALGSLGFGFIEIGTVTPKPQSGNAKPRLFRLPEQQAIINRMGFNNKGVDYLVARVQQKKYRGIVGINIGKNAATPLENAIDDYVIGLQKTYVIADYITVNISSPNTSGLRALQSAAYLENLVVRLQEEQQRLYASHKKYTPVLIKIAPDLSDEDLAMMTSIFNKQKVDGIIATNTTIDRQSVRHEPNGQETGGLSGAPLFKLATSVQAKLAQQLDTNIPIIGSGGIMNARDAETKFAQGATLVQLYTGLIYQGPQLIKDCLAVCC